MKKNQLSFRSVQSPETEIIEIADKSETKQIFFLKYNRDILWIHSKV